MSSFDEKERIVLENINANDKELVGALEKRIAHFCDRVELLTNDLSDISESDYTEVFGNFDSDVDISDVVDENKGYIKGMLDKVASFDRIKLAELLGKKISGSLVLDNVEEPSGNSKVIYLKNSLADISVSDKKF